MAFLAIHPAPRLPAGLARLPGAVGPPAVRVRRPYPDMLATAGFTDIEQEDVTAAYRATVLAWHDQSARWAARLMEHEGGPGFEARQSKRKATLAAIDAGALRRSLFTAQRPGGR